MKVALRSAFAVTLLLLAAQISAQEAQQSISLDEALSITLSENPAIKAIHFEERAAQQERRAAIGLRMPKISVGGTYTYLGKDIGFDFNNMKGPIKDFTGALAGSGILPPELIPPLQNLMAPLMKADWFLMLQDRSLGFVGGQMTMPIWLGGKINVANRAAKIEEKTALAQGDQTRNALVSELVERYFGLSLALQVVEVRQQVVDGVQKHLNDAIALEKNGMIAQAERLYVAFKMAEAERELANAKLQAQTISDALNNTLGRENACLPVTAMFMIDNIESVGFYQQLAEQRNPLLNQVTFKRQLAEEGVRLQRSEFLPQVVAMGGGTFYNYQVTNIMPRWAVGVGVNIKIFDGLHREYKYSAAKQTAQRVGALQTKAERDIALLVEKLYNQMLNYRNQMSSIDASMTFSEEYLRIKNAAFLEGMSSSTELVDAELNLAKVRTERLQAAYQFDVLLAKLLEAAGVSDEFLTYARRADSRPIHFSQK